MSASSRAKRDFWIQTGIVLFLIVLFVAAVIRSMTKPLTVEDLGVHVSDLRSLCSAGVELSDQFSAGHVTETFFESDLELKHEKITSTRETLDSADAAPKAMADLETARALAERTGVAFDGLSSRDETVAGRARNELTRLVGALKQLEDELKKGVGE